MEEEGKIDIPDMNSLNIIIEANREDTEPWRLNRIQRVVGYAQALADMNNQSDFYKRIYSICDDKGFLEVVWNSEPTDQEKDWIFHAWNSTVAGWEDHIDHEVK